jgi:hypothetical protein
MVGFIAMLSPHGTWAPSPQQKAPAAVIDLQRLNLQLMSLYR